jgi:hypothetical protein
MAGLEGFLRAIPAAATNPYAFIAYITSALLFITSVIQRRHLKPVMKIIDKVPEKDRKSVIETTLNTKLPENLTGEQYLREEKMKYTFFAFMGLLVLIGGITTIALIGRAASQPSKNAQIRVQLWPRPEIKDEFLKNHDARLYLKSDTAQLDLTSFVPTPDFLDQSTSIDENLLGKSVDLTIAPRDKYTLVEDRRYLTRLVRLEVYPLGQNPVPKIVRKLNDSGESVLTTTDLPISSLAAVLEARLARGGHPSLVNIKADQPYIFYLQGNNLTTDTKLEIVDERGLPVSGAWAGNEPGTSNGKPAEVATDGDFLKAYFAVPLSASGHKLYWRVHDSSNQVAREVQLNVTAPNKPL